MEDNKYLTYLGKKIRERRQALGMTQEELAFKVGYSTKDSVCKIEKGQINVPANRITAFSKVLNMHPSEFFDLTSNVTSKKNAMMVDYQIILDILENADETQIHQIRLIVETFRKE